MRRPYDQEITGCRRGMVSASLPGLCASLEKRLPFMGCFTGRGATILMFFGTKIQMTGHMEQNNIAMMSVCDLS